MTSQAQTSYTKNTTTHSARTAHFSCRSVCWIYQQGKVTYRLWPYGWPKISLPGCGKFRASCCNAGRPHEPQKRAPKKGEIYDQRTSCTLGECDTLNQCLSYSKLEYYYFMIQSPFGIFQDSVFMFPCFNESIFIPINVFLISGPLSLQFMGAAAYQLGNTRSAFFRHPGHELGTS